MLAVGAGRFFLPRYWPLFIGRKYWEKIASNSLFSLSPVVNQKGSPAPAALAAGVGHYFLSFPIYLLSLLIMVSTKMTSLETFQSNVIKNTTNSYVDCNTVSWFSICSQTKLDSCTIPYLILLIFVALCLHKRSNNFYKCKRQPF